MNSLLTVRAGPVALERLRDRAGFDPNDVSTLLGASGGPKWLVLSQIDRVLAQTLVRNRTAPLAVVGSSIGTFRHLCLAQSDPASAIDRFERAYIDQAYETEPTPDEVTRESATILDELFGHDGKTQVLRNPRIHTHILAVRSKTLVRTERRLPLALGLGGAALANAIDRRLLGSFFERTVFHSPPEPTLQFAGFGTRSVQLGPENLAEATLASGSIPLVMSGITDIPGAPTGCYRDGGIVDYHFDFAFRAPDGLILYPHFFDRMTPGWFDKTLRWRRPRGTALDRTLLITPSEEFIRALPGSRVPDRSDFRALPTRERQERWWTVVDRCRSLADELAERLMGGGLAQIAQPFA